MENEFLVRLSAVLAKESAASLLRTYQQLPAQLVSKCSNTYRERVLAILTDTWHDWKEPELAAIIACADTGFAEPATDLLHSLFTLPEHANIFRKVFARFVTNPRLKGLLPKLLGLFVFTLSKQQLERMRIDIVSMGTDCKNWYRSLPQQDVVYHSLQKLSLIVPPPKVDVAMWPTSELVAMGKARIQRASNEQLLKAAPQVGLLRSDSVLKMFYDLVKQKLQDILVREAAGRLDRTRGEEAVSESLAWIYEKGNTLNVPNRLCERLVEFIIEHKLNQNIYHANTDVKVVIGQLTDLRFWTLALSARGQVSELQKTLASTRTRINALATAFVTGDLTIGHASSVLSYPNKSLLHLFGAARQDEDERNAPSLITGDVLYAVNESIARYHHRLTLLRAHVETFGPLAKATNHKSVLAELIQREREAQDLRVASIDDTILWSSYEGIIPVAEIANPLLQSRTLKNIIIDSVAATEERWDFEAVAMRIVLPAVERFRKHARGYERWHELECEAEKGIWKGVNDVHSIEGELEFMRRNDGGPPEKGSADAKDLVYALQSLAVIDERVQQMNAIVQLKQALFPEDEDNASASSDNLANLIGAQLSTLQDTEYSCSLKEIYDFNVFFTEHLADIVNDRAWELWKALLDTPKLLAFLRQIEHEDLKNWINAVDDLTDDSAAQEAPLVTSAEEVKRELLPILLLQNPSTRHLLKELNALVKKNPHAASKLLLCNQNLLSLQQIHLNISNRGEATKERIKNAVDGTYIFERAKGDNACSVTLEYVDKGGACVTYSHADLVDLRGRGLLLVDSTNKFGREFSSAVLNEQNKEVMDCVKEFVGQVDLVGEIMDLGANLIRLGHFAYQEFEALVKSLAEMKDLRTTFANDLTDWEVALEKSRSKSYFLTYFMGRHLIVFRDLFSGFSDDPVATKQTCAALFRYYNRNASPTISDTTSEADEFLTLDHISELLEDVLGPLPTNPEPIPKNFGRHVMSDIVVARKLFVAVCNNQNLVPNVVLSLYANHGRVPQPSQVLICQPTTTEEELNLLLMRCFWESRAADGDDQLFCIAAVEMLPFETQLFLVKRIRELQAQHTTLRYFLSLVCVRGDDGPHHLFDEFAESVRFTDGLGADAMGNIIRGITKDSVQILTSDISGQGKTHFVKNFAAAVDARRRILLICDMIDRAEIVRQLHEPPLHPEEELLHIIVGKVTNPSELNLFLFELLILRVIFAGAEVAFLPREIPVFIELESVNMAGNGNRRARTGGEGSPALDIVSFTAHFRRQHLTFNVDALDMPEIDYVSPTQVVSRYLFALRNCTLDGEDVDLAATPILPVECRRLLHDHFQTNHIVTTPSMRLLDTFVRVLADQLRHLSQSPFLSVVGLNLTGTDASNTRTTLVNALIDVSHDFALRSIATNSSAAESPDYIEYMNTMTKWSDSNHLLVFFQSQNEGCICTLYRNPTHVKPNIKQLLMSQSIPQLGASATQPFQFSNMQTETFAIPEFSEMPASELLKILEMIARTSQVQRTYPSYALSTDNLLKMALILLRTRARVPVVLCGEAANMAEVKFLVLDVHAGITKDKIIEFMAAAEDEAKRGEVWIFLDEINTCNHLGMLANLICDRVLMGHEIHSNICLIAACNPYRRRKRFANDAGLERLNGGGELPTQYEEQSKLVYQVYPLPQKLLDFIWDYGVLEERDERAYIGIMVEGLELHSDSGDVSRPSLHFITLFAELLFRSQQFIRDIEDAHSVSLRDVRRAIGFVRFFDRELNSPARRQLSRLRQTRNHYPPIADLFRNVRPIVLALALCYQGRLSDQTSRLQYRRAMCEIFVQNRVAMDNERFANILRDDQLDIISRMRLPPLTACNEALLENVHSMTSCILTRTPLFLIGAPGASKSLAVKIIKENLRGRDSIDPYFQTHPQVYIIPHQGSSSSTSEGILKVFAKAQRYETRHDPNRFPSRAVVLLDEVGLAETSPHNPLKVLHALLEPRGSEDGSPPVAVIGISNWRLDASKMSRAVRILKPAQGINDLEETTRRLVTSIDLRSDELSILASEYTNYQLKQPVANFHGLRDYYALIKGLGSHEELTPTVKKNSLARNFGGGQESPEALYHRFFPSAHNDGDRDDDSSEFPSALACIKASLGDIDARHLMVIGETDLTIDVLENCLSAEGDDVTRVLKTPRVIYGSQFPADQGPAYAYGVLNTILLCVEEGRPVILKDLQIIYGSLYDLWNQNYTSVGSGKHEKKFCRVALGEYANSMCPVHPDFRCIVVMDNNAVANADPPLLNRFEKQHISWDSLLSHNNREIVKELNKWVRWISTLQQRFTSSQPFDATDMFVGFCGLDTLRCLVLRHSDWGKITDKSAILTQCKQDLIEIACSESIVRASKSLLAAESHDEISHWQNFFFKRGKHNNLRSFVEEHLLSDDRESSGNVIIKTFSSINSNIQRYLEELDGSLTCQVEKLELFKSERQLQSRIRHFWLESRNNLLVIQCDPATTTQGSMKLARFLVDHHRKEFISLGHQEQRIKKCACIIVHIHRGFGGAGQRMFQFDFLCDWYQIVIENLAPQRPLILFLEDSMCGVVQKVYPFHNILVRELQWCILCIRYTALGSLDHIRRLMTEIPAHHGLVRFLQRWVENWLEEQQSRDWQFRIACDRQQLGLSTSFSSALEKHIRHMVREPLAKMIYALEKTSALPSFLRLDPSQHVLMQLWEDVCLERRVVRAHEEEEPRPNGYYLGGRLYNLRFPFSRYFYQSIEGFRQFYQQERRDHGGVGIAGIRENFVARVLSSVPFLQHRAFSEFSELYLSDFMEMVLPAGTLARHRNVMQALMLREFDEKIANSVELHILWWGHGERLLVQLRIVQFCSLALGYEINADKEHGNLVDLSSRRVLSRLRDFTTDTPNGDTDQAYEEWLRNASLLLAVCSVVPEFTARPSWRVLSFVRDLCSTLVFPKHIALQPLVDMIGDVEHNDIRNTKVHAFVADTLSYLASDTVPECAEKETCRHLLLSQILDVALNGSEMMSFESLLDLRILEKVFARVPLPLSAPLVHRIFKAENNRTPGLFYRILEIPEGDTRAVQRLSEGMHVVSRCLERAGLESAMTIICCDVIYERYFAFETTKRLALLLPNAVDILVDERKQGGVLRYVCAVALFKALLRGLALQCHRDPYVINMDDFATLDNFLDDGEPELVHRTVVFFLQSLRDQLGLSTVALRRHLEPFHVVLRWVANIDWKLNYGQTDFDPYCFNQQAVRAAEAFALLQTSHSDSHAAQLLPLQDYYSRLGFLGVAVNTLCIPITTPWDDGRLALASWLQGVQVSPLVRLVLDRLVLDRVSPLIPRDAENSRALLLHSVVARAIVVHAAMNPECSPLARYIHMPDEVQRNFVITCPLDERTAVLMAMRAAGDNGAYTTEYRCVCGTTYVITNCGRPWVESRCPTCKNVIGGQRHNISGNSRVVNEPLVDEVVGYTQEATETLRDPTKSVRTLTTAAFRMLHLFVHAIFAFQPAAIAYAVTDRDPVLYCLEHVENDWDMLRQILLCNDETMHLLLHAVLTRMERDHDHIVAPLSTSKMVEDWETEFMNAHVTPMVADMHQTLAIYRREIGGVGRDQHLLEHEIKETLDLNDMDAGQESFARLWRYTSQLASPEDAVREMRAFVCRDPDRQRRFPVLQLFFKHKDNLDMLIHLMPLARFANELLGMFAHRINRDQARKLTFAALLERVREERDEHTYERLFRLFDEFKRAWNAIRSSVTHYQCQELKHEMPTMDATRAVIFALYETADEAVYLCAALEQLARLQNAFLDDIDGIERDKCPSLLFLQPTDVFATATNGEEVHHGRALAWPSVTFHDLQESQVVYVTDNDYDSQLLTFYQLGLDYGGAQNIEFDLAELEWRLARLLILGKAHIQPEMEGFPYAGEMFRHNMRIADEIAALVPQEPLEAGRAAQICGDEHIRDIAPDLLSDLQMVLCYLERTQGGDGEMFLADYCRGWLNQHCALGGMRSSLSVLTDEVFARTCLGEVRLKHVVAAYEVIEDMVFDLLLALTPNEFVPSSYMLPLKDHVGRDLTAACHAASLTDTVATALKRFVFRHLRDSGCTIPADASIDDYAELVSRDEAIIAVLPPDLLVGHTLEAFLLLTKKRQAPPPPQAQQNEADETMDPEERRQLEEALHLSMQDANSNQGANRFSTAILPLAVVPLKSLIMAMFKPDSSEDFFDEADFAPAIQVSTKESNAASETSDEDDDDNDEKFFDAPDNIDA
ncbi:hypothetical protein BC938DRAFT_479135 [Jimgerdemannia flammicorona]|uniref:RZ-type domain-containing protein n=1 Tax=Jimgerdemannia flammicorona TaxID=994334 RepID=A0A433QY99_9FUNG|nr:hypothetical protein BC938DRAFT_479135 [Jimgerdemannia flammicorona]